MTKEKISVKQTLKRDCLYTLPETRIFSLNTLDLAPSESSKTPVLMDIRRRPL